MIDQKSNRDYLSHLPSELLDYIFYHAHDSSRPLTTPLSKCLLPFQRRQLFRSIKVHSYRSLENLCTITQGQPRIYSCIRELDVKIEMEQISLSLSDAKEAEDPGSPSNAIVERFLRQLPNLKTFKILGSTRITLLLLSPPVTSFLRRLESLDICSTLHALSDPFNMPHYTGLQSCSMLGSLRLTLLRDSPSIKIPTQPELDSKPFANITKLQLIGPLSSDVPSARRFLSSFNSLSFLSLFDTSSASFLIPLIQKLLEALPAPHQLDILKIGGQFRFDTSNKGDFARCFESLTRLRTLTLLSDFSSFHPELYSDLRALTIRTLQFSFKAYVSLDQLTALVSGPTKHSTLKSIGLDQIKGRIGTRIKDVGEPYWDEVLSEWKPYSDWILPKWTDQFSEAGLVDFLDVAKQEMIRVDGSAVDAIGIRAHRDRK